MHTDKKHTSQETIPLDLPLRHFFTIGHPFAPTCIMPVIYGEGISAQNTCQGQTTQNNFWKDIENNNKIIEALKNNNIKTPRHTTHIISQLSNLNAYKRADKLNELYNTTGNSFRISLSPNKEDTISRFNIKRKTPGCFTITRKNVYGKMSDSGLGYSLRLILEDTNLETLKQICEYTDIESAAKNQAEIKLNEKIKNAFPANSKNTKNTKTQDKQDLENKLLELITKFNQKISDNKLTTQQLQEIANSICEKLIWTACEDNNYKHYLDYEFINEYLIDLDDTRILKPAIKYDSSDTVEASFFQGAFNQGDMTGTEEQVEKKIKENISIYIQFFIGIINYHAYMQESEKHMKPNNFTDFGHKLEQYENLLEEFIIQIQSDIITKRPLLQGINIFFETYESNFGLRTNYFSKDKHHNWNEIIKTANQFSYFLGQQGSDAHKDEFLLISPQSKRPKYWRHIGQNICIYIDEDMKAKPLPDSLHEFNKNNQQNPNPKPYILKARLTQRQLISFYNDLEKETIETHPELKIIFKENLELFAENARYTKSHIMNKIISLCHDLSPAGLTSLLYAIVYHNNESVMNERNINLIANATHNILDITQILIILTTWENIKEKLPTPELLSLEVKEKYIQKILHAMRPLVTIPESESESHDLRLNTEQKTLIENNFYITADFINIKGAKGESILNKAAICRDKGAIKIILEIIPKSQPDIIENIIDQLYFSTLFGDEYNSQILRIIPLISDEKLNLLESKNINNLVKLLSPHLNYLILSDTHTYTNTYIIKKQDATNILKKLYYQKEKLSYNNFFLVIKYILKNKDHLPEIYNLITRQDTQKILIIQELKRHKDMLQSKETSIFNEIRINSQITIINNIISLFKSETKNHTNHSISLEFKNILDRSQISSKNFKSSKTKELIYQAAEIYDVRLT